MLALIILYIITLLYLFLFRPKVSNTNGNFKKEITNDILIKKEVNDTFINLESSEKKILMKIMRNMVEQDDIIDNKTKLITKDKNKFDSNDINNKNREIKMAKNISEIEMNELSFTLSIIYDKRVYMKCYLSLLKFRILFLF